MLLTDYRRLLQASLTQCPGDQRRAALRYLARTDLFFLLVYLCGRKDIERQWLFDRCREVQNEPDGFLDLWAREHYKSTIITFGKTIQDILASHGDEPLVPNEVTVGIFAHTRPIAKAFLRQIKRELESNQALKDLFPDILYQNPKAQAVQWSEDDGIIVKRKSNPKEATIEAWGLVDGQPISKHFSLLIYDDVVTKASVNTPEMVAKTTEALELSYNLGADGGRRRFIGTRYAFGDTYKTVIDRGTAKPRIYPATDDGTIDGAPVLLSRETLMEKRRDMGPYTFSAQMLQNPIADTSQGFRRDWLRYYDGEADKGTNRILIVDPANSKKKHSDYTAMWVVGLGADNNVYVLDIVRDRLNLTERAALVFELHRKWKPYQVRYERIGMQADVEHLRSKMRDDNYRFELVEVGGTTPKPERIKRLVPWFEEGRIYLPRKLKRTNYEGVSVDLVHQFIEEEYTQFPVAEYDDMMDSLARLAEPDLPLKWPREREPRPSSHARAPAGWMV